MCGVDTADNSTASRNKGGGCPNEQFQAFTVDLSDLRAPASRMCGLSVQSDSETLPDDKQRTFAQSVRDVVRARAPRIPFFVNNDPEALPRVLQKTSAQSAKLGLTQLSNY